MQAAPITTLAGAASQSMVRPRAGMRWRLVATSAAAALVAGGASVLTLTRVAAPQGVQPAGVVAATPPSPPPADAAPVASGSAHHDAPAPNDPPARRVPPAPPPRAASSPAAVVRKGELAILVRPWAMIWLNGRELGQTPFRDTVAAGKYSLRIANDTLGIDETTTITVSPERTTTIERSWRGE